MATLVAGFPARTTSVAPPLLVWCPPAHPRVLAVAVVVVGGEAAAVVEVAVEASAARAAHPICRPRPRPLSLTVLTKANHAWS